MRFGCGAVACLALALGPSVLGQAVNLTLSDADLESLSSGARLLYEQAVSDFNHLDSTAGLRHLSLAAEQAPQAATLQLLVARLAVDAMERSSSEEQATELLGWARQAYQRVLENSHAPTWRRRQAETGMSRLGPLMDEVRERCQRQAPPGFLSAYNASLAAREAERVEELQRMRERQATAGVGLPSSVGVPGPCHLEVTNGSSDVTRYIFEDGTLLGTVPPHQTSTLELSPGEHRLAASISMNPNDNAVVFTAGPGGFCRLEVHGSSGGEIPSASEAASEAAREMRNLRPPRPPRMPR